MIATAQRLPTLEDIRHERRRRHAQRAVHSLAEHLKFVWEIIEPGTPLIWNWHLDLLCRELEAITEGGAFCRPVEMGRDEKTSEPRVFEQMCDEEDEGARWVPIKRLVLCIPPGTMKSILVSVAWPTWEWLRKPHLRGMYLSNDDDLVKRDSRRCREIVESDDYQLLKDAAYDAKVEGNKAFKDADRWDLADDQNEKHNFANTRHGFRQCMSIGAKVTGKRADKQVIDDPIDAKEVVNGSIEQVSKRMKETLGNYDSVLNSRLNDLRSNPRIVIMQRLHDLDLAGQLIRRGYRYVVLPMEYEPDHPHRHPDDIRAEKGELLFPELFPRDVVEEIKNTPESARHYRSQYTQWPQPDTGSMFKREYFRYYSVDRDGQGNRWYILHDPDNGDRRVPASDCWRFSSADTAMTTKSYSDYTVLGTYDVSKTTDSQGKQVPGDIIKIHHWRERSQTPEVEKVFRNNLITQKPLFIGIEDKNDGKVINQRFRRDHLPILPIKADRDKVTRAGIFQMMMSQGRFWLPLGEEWVSDFESELLSFPEVEHDDQVDEGSIACSFAHDRDLWMRAAPAKDKPGTIGAIAKHTERLRSKPKRKKKDPFA